VAAAAGLAAGPGSATPAGRRLAQHLGGWLPHLVGLALFALALWVIHGELARFRPADLLGQLGAIPPAALALALLAAALGYGALTLYDPLALRHLGKDLPYRQTALASFAGYAFSHNLGLGWLSGGAVRYRLYSVWGLSSLDVGTIIAFNTITTSLGLAAILGLAALGETAVIARILHLPQALVVGVGVALLALIVGYMFACALRQSPLRLRGWHLSLPRPTTALAQLGLSLLDWTFAATVLYVLLPAGLPFGFAGFVGVFGLASLGGLISNVPGGVGVFEAAVLLAVPDPDASAAVAAALIAYRLIYYLLPLGVAVLLLGGQQLLSAGARARQVGSWTRLLAPNLFAAMVFAAGIMLLAAGAAPTLDARMRTLAAAVPHGVIELSHFLASVVGLVLLLVAWGLRRRLDGAWLAALALLALGAVLSLLRGLHFEQAALLTLTMLALLPCRAAFYRRSALTAAPLSTGWLLAVAAVLLGVVWLGFFSYRHVEYGNELWWRFVLAEDAPHSLRATAGALILFLIVGVGRLLRGSRRPALALREGDVARAGEVIKATPAAPVSAQLALLGDKNFLFSDSGRSFVMFGIHGSSWIALGEPVGPPEERQEILWRFRELCDRHGTWPAFYQVTPESLPQLLELGLTFQKLGEEALVPLAGFEVEGPERKGLRYTLRRLRREGCAFEIIPVEGVPAVLASLHSISDHWLAAKNVREKGFSLGRFEPDYLRNFPVAVVRVESRIVAFANVWASGDRRELSIDLMRHTEDAPHSIMEYLFLELMLWGKAEGYQRFSLGMVPLAGLERRRLAPLWSQAGAFLFRYGEHFYNFQGLLRFKAKFAPVWEPRYLAAPGGFALPRVLGDATLLISGGMVGLVTR
jgi:phosphatidylglycerol lysyltransferase